MSKVSIISIPQAEDHMVDVPDDQSSDTIIYATSGHGVLLVSPSLDPVKAIKADFKGQAPPAEEEQPRRRELSPGDFAFVPAWTEHQVVNEGDVGDVVWVVTRNGGGPVQVDLVGWGGERVGR